MHRPADAVPLEPPPRHRPPHGAHGRRRKHDPQHDGRCAPHEQAADVRLAHADRREWARLGAVERDEQGGEVVCGREEEVEGEEEGDDELAGPGRGGRQSGRIGSGAAPRHADTHIEPPDLGRIIEKHERERDDKPRPEAEQARDEAQPARQACEVGKRLCAQKPGERVLFERLEDVRLGGMEIVGDARVSGRVRVWRRGELVDPEGGSGEKVTRGAGQPGLSMRVAVLRVQHRHTHGR